MASVNIIPAVVNLSLSTGEAGDLGRLLVGIDFNEFPHLRDLAVAMGSIEEPSSWRNDPITTTNNDL